jgi:DNA-binding response OmpR family regulator
MKRSLLMIEDDGQLSLVVSQYLRHNGWDFQSSSTGAEGVAKAAKVRPDVVLLDVQLPDGEGWDFCRKLREQPALTQTAVVMVSGNRFQPTDKARGLEAGADDFLAKPFDLTELVLRLDAILKTRGK